MELNFKAIGKRIKIARIRTNLTQETVADKIGVTPQHVSNIEYRQFQSQFDNTCCYCKSAECIR